VLLGGTASVVYMVGVKEQKLTQIALELEEKYQEALSNDSSSASGNVSTHNRSARDWLKAKKFY